MAAAAAATALLGGCGGSAGDVLALEVWGGPLPAKQILVVTLDGRGSCGRDKLRPIPNDRELDAKGVAREAKKLAESSASFVVGRTGGRHYVLRLPQGSVNWQEGAPGIPPVLAQAQLLALRLGRTLCGQA